MRRLRLFLALVYRPVTGPVGREARGRWRYRLSPSVAWELAGLMAERRPPRPRQRARVPRGG